MPGPNDIRDATTVAKQEAFLEAYEKVGIVGPACQKAGVGRSTYYYWRESDEEFAQKAADAYQLAVDVAELELRNRAVEGIDEIVMYRGEPVWKRDPSTGEIMLDKDFEPIPLTIRRRSDKLLETYMKANRHRYRDKSSVEVSGPEGGPVETKAITVEYVLPEGMTKEDYDTPREGDVPAKPGWDKTAANKKPDDAEPFD